MMFNALAAICAYDSVALLVELAPPALFAHWPLLYPTAGYWEPDAPTGSRPVLRW